ncbi:hypothetical protein [Haloarchaeobius amylolyticus]|uniref:hypothetical protein n=1 Tax=Haloarchaeobius amylolyticus TaxID=1198296 RepID=UPI00226D404F|nr:hypothetical protein [Haloarchaeobius amylolyticus]
MATRSDGPRYLDDGDLFTGLYGPVNRLLLLVGALLLKISVQLTFFGDSMAGAAVYYLVTTALVALAVVGRDHLGTTGREGDGGRRGSPGLSSSKRSAVGGSSLGDSSASLSARVRRGLVALRAAVPGGADDMDRL